MGVPILFAWMNQKHSNCLKNTPPDKVDNLYIDFNALIHNCYNPNLDSINAIYSDMVDRLVVAIDNLVARTQPSSILYIAVDGVAPGAKLAHQRGRRFKAASDKQIEIKQEKSTTEESEWENVIVNNEEELMDKFEPEDEIGVEDLDLLKPKEAAFDSNAISSGTELMEYLHLELLKVFQHKISTDKKYSHLKIIYSSYLVPGEGEQKIIKFIKKYSQSNPEAVHVMYSPDGDVIFLGVGMINVTFYIMREDTFNSPNKKSICGVCSKLGHTTFECGKPFLAKFTYVDVLSFVSELTREFNHIIRGRFDTNRMLFDWILVCFMIGNDFVPGLPCLDIKIASIESLTGLICKNYLTTRDYLMKSDGTLNSQPFEAFMYTLSKLEDNYYVAKTRLLNRFIKDQSREQIPLQTRDGKLKYYSTKLHANNQDDIDHICREYMTGLMWIFNYYIKGFTDWNWVYPYHFAPFACDLVNVCKSCITLKRGHPLSPFEQLLVLIPPQSKQLIPDKLQLLYEKHKDCFPTDVEIDMFDKYLSWAGIVMLPQTNFTPVLKESRSFINSMSVVDLERNIRDTDLLFCSEEKLVDIVYRLYMGLKPCQKIYIDKIPVKIYPYYMSNFPGDEITLKDGKVFVNKSMITRLDKI